MYTTVFNVDSGVKQDDLLSPLLFSLFINELARDINSQHCGVKVGIDEINILLYTDTDFRILLKNLWIVCRYKVANIHKCCY